jgi:hypothetical protein
MGWERGYPGRGLALGDAKVVTSLAASVVLLAAFTVIGPAASTLLPRGCSATVTGPART